ncbi:CoF synthetase [Mariniflexile sp.]|uniref:CoF synthetase n=1 Tax=Mariniflexile sp. TaxID=1979402 RepID=UPI0035679B11
MLFNRIRNLTFHLSDFISGGMVNRHIKDINEILNFSSAEDFQNQIKKKLEDLFRHATSTTNFYSSYGGSIDLKDFPIIEKSIVQNNFEDFKSKKFLNKKYYKVSTSGSTGVPFFLFQDKNKRKRNTADVIYFFKKSGFEVGDRLYEFEVWRSHNKKGKLKSLLQNVYQFDVSKLTDDNIIQLLKVFKSDKTEKSFLGFSSAYETICQFLDKTNDEANSNFNVKSIIANSEYLNEYTKLAMAKHFKAPIYSRYSNEELGLIAQQINESGDDFVINWASYYIELLDLNSDEPVNYGEPGRIVVTDFYNYYMPLIRFDTGDVGIFTNPIKGELPKFKHIEGRKMDIIFDTSGNMISSFVVYTKFYKFYHLLKQYQFIQLSEKEYLIKVNIAEGEFNYEKELVNDVKKDFGMDAIVNIEYVDEIPCLASGKRKKVVSLYEKASKN